VLLPISRAADQSIAFYANFRDGLIEGLRELGHEALLFEFEQPTRASPREHAALFRLLTHKPCDLVLDLCCWGCELSQFRVWDGTPEGEPIYDAFELPCVAMLYDHPWFQTLPRILASRLYASLPDRYGAEQIALVYPGVKLRGWAMAPPAIRKANDHSQAGSERSIDVLYVGNLALQALERPWRDIPAAAAAFDTVADWALAHPERPLHHALTGLAGVQGVALDAELASAVLRAVDYYIRAHLRLEAVGALAQTGASMLVVGEGWREVELPSNVNVQAALPYDRFLALAGNARICLDCSNYPGGANDRVFNYTLNGAVCFTNAAEFSAEALGQDRGLRVYSMLELGRLGEQVRSALAQPERLRADGEHAARVTAATQTWRQRVENIWRAVFDAAP